MSNLDDRDNFTTGDRHAANNALLVKRANAVNDSVRQGIKYKKTGNYLKKRKVPEVANNDAMGDNADILC